MAFKTSTWQLDDPCDERQKPTDDETAQRRSEAKRKKAEQRQQIQHRLEAEGETELADKIAACGLPIALTCTHCGEATDGETHCRRRWCPACANLVQQRRLERHSGAVALMKHPAFLTLTITNSPDPNSIKKLRADWSKMRRRKIIAERVSGGIAAIEITNHGNGWHPHLHAIIDTPWLAIATPEPHWTDTAEEYALKLSHAQAELAILWAATTKQHDGIVWIKRCKSEAALIYSLAYAIAGEQLVECQDDIGPLIKVIEKSRLVSAFGNLHGRTAEMLTDEKPTTCCKHCGEEKSIVPTAVAYYGVRRDQADDRTSVPIASRMQREQATKIG